VVRPAAPEKKMQLHAVQEGKWRIEKEEANTRLENKKKPK
jgi:hypothetical protein